VLERLLNFVGTLYKNRYMIRSFAKADLKKRYADSYGGVAWAVIQPLMMILTYYVIFSYVFKRKVQADYGTDSYALWLISGLLPWFFFSESVRRSSGALLENRALVTKTLFPSEIIPVCLIVSGLVNHIIGLGILFVFSVVISGGISVYSGFVVIYFLLMAVMILGLNWALSSLNAFIRDISQGVTIIMNLWFYYTPIIYPAGIVPEKYRWILEINPMYYIVEGYRDSLVAGRLPDPYKLLYLAVFSVSVFALGGLLYKRLKPAFIDVL